MNSDHPRPTPILIATLITALLFGVYALLPSSSPNTSPSEAAANDPIWLAHPQLLFTHQDITRSRASFYPLSPTQSPEATSFAEKILKSYQDANAMHFTSVTPNAEKVEQALTIYADQWFEHQPTFQSFIHLGDPLFDSCDRELEGIVNNLQHITSELQETDFLKQLQDDPSYETYRRSCGDLLPLLLASHLVSRSQGWRTNDGPAVVSALQRRRFADIIALRTPWWLAISPADVALVVWWKTMIPDSFSPTERLSNIPATSQLPPELLNPSSPFFIDTSLIQKSIRQSSR